MTTEQSNQLQSIYERVQDLSIYDILNMQFQKCWYYENCQEYGKYSPYTIPYDTNVMIFQFFGSYSNGGILYNGNNVTPICSKVITGTTKIYVTGNTNVTLEKVVPSIFFIPNATTNSVIELTYTSNAIAGLTVIFHK